MMNIIVSHLKKIPVFTPPHGTTGACQMQFCNPVFAISVATPTDQTLSHQRCNHLVTIRSCQCHKISGMIAAVPLRS